MQAATRLPHHRLLFTIGLPLVACVEMGRASRCLPGYLCLRCNRRFVGTGVEMALRLRVCVTTLVLSSVSDSSAMIRFSLLMTGASLSSDKRSMTLFSCLTVVGLGLAVGFGLIDSLVGGLHLDVFHA